MSTAGGLVFYGDNTGGAVDCRRREDRTTSMAVRHSAGLEVEPDDLCDRREAVRRRGRGIDGEGVWIYRTDIRIVPTDERYVESLNRALDIVAWERRYIGFVEGPPMESTRTFIRHVLSGEGVQRLAVTHDDEVVGWCDIVRRGMEGFPMRAAWEWACSAGLSRSRPRTPTAH